MQIQGPSGATASAGDTGQIDFVRDDVDVYA
jgi:hypothetical protein